MKGTKGAAMKGGGASTGGGKLVAPRAGEFMEDMHHGGDMTHSAGFLPPQAQGQLAAGINHANGSAQRSAAILQQTGPAGIPMVLQSEAQNAAMAAGLGQRPQRGPFDGTEAHGTAEPGGVMGWLRGLTSD